MRIISYLPAIAGLALAHPALEARDQCSVTTELVVPSTTVTFTTHSVVTETATTPKDQGTFTMITRVYSTSTLSQTQTTTTTECTSQGTVQPTVTSTVYGSASAPARLAVKLKQVGDASSDCTTITSTTTYGTSYTLAYVGTSTFTQYSQFVNTWVTSTSNAGVAYAVATATATQQAVCGVTAAVESDTPTTTVTYDARCAPTALVSSSGGFGLSYIDDHPLYPGAAYVTNATSASACCQLCAEAFDCSTSAFDIRTGACHLDFIMGVDSNFKSTGELTCSGQESVFAYYDAGPNHPMQPGTGWFIGTICGKAEFGQQEPDDGT